MPFYQVLLGGFQSKWRTDFEYPASIDVEAGNAEPCGAFADGVFMHPCLEQKYPAYREERHHAFMMQPGIGLDVRIRRQVAVRVAADLALPREPRVRGRLLSTVRLRRHRLGALVPCGSR